MAKEKRRGIAGTVERKLIGKKITETKKISRYYFYYYYYYYKYLLSVFIARPAAAADWVCDKNAPDDDDDDADDGTETTRATRPNCTRRQRGNGNGRRSNRVQCCDRFARALCTSTAAVHARMRVVDVLVFICFFSTRFRNVNARRVIVIRVGASTRILCG